MYYFRRKYDLARNLLFKSQVLAADLFIAQHSLTRMFVVAKLLKQMKLLGILSVKK